MDLTKELPRLLPMAIEWAEKQEQRGAEAGSSLAGNLLEIARQVGVQHPELIRLTLVERLPQPDNPTLRIAAREAGLLAPGVVGLTLGYAVFIVAGQQTVRLVSHECRHVYQYERYGSIKDFLPVYLSEMLTYGYRNAPLEIDARTHEIHAV